MTESRYGFFRILNSFFMGPVTPSSRYTSYNALKSKFFQILREIRQRRFLHVENLARQTLCLLIPEPAEDSLAPIPWQQIGFSAQSFIFRQRTKVSVGREQKLTGYPKLQQEQRSAGGMLPFFCQVRIAAVRVLEAE